MTAFPAAAYLNNSARTVAEEKQGFEDFLAATKQLPGGTAISTLTIASGSIVPTSGNHAVDTEASAASDDLTNITQTNTPDGRYLLIQPANGSRTVVVKHNAGGTGQITLASALDFSMIGTDTRLLLRRTSTSWEEVFRNSGKRSMSNKNANLFTALTASQTISGLHDGAVLVYSASGGSITQALPSAASVGDGFELTLKKSDSSVNTVTADGNSSETIDGALTYVLSNQYESVTLRCDGTGWHVIANKGASFITSHTFTVVGAVAVASGATNYIPGMFSRVRTGYTRRVTGYRCVTRAGSVTFDFKKNGSNLTGFTGITATTSAGGANPTAVVLADNDYLVPVVSSVASTPDGLSITLFIEEFRA